MTSNQQPTHASPTPEASSAAVPPEPLDLDAIKKRTANALEAAREPGNTLAAVFSFNRFAFETIPALVAESERLRAAVPPDARGIAKAIERRMAALEPHVTHKDGVHSVLVHYGDAMIAFYGDKDQPNRWDDLLDALTSPLDGVGREQARSDASRLPPAAVLSLVEARLERLQSEIGYERYSEAENADLEAERDELRAFLASATPKAGASVDATNPTD